MHIRPPQTVLSYKTSLTGTFEEPLGTHMFFTEVEPQPSDNIFERVPERQFELLACTDKLLHMQRVFVEPKATNTTEEEGQTTKERQKYVVDKTYQEALETLLKPGQTAPRTVTDALDSKIMLQRGVQMDCEESE